MVVVRRNINKARHQYFSFINQEGLTYIKEYVEERIKRGERITNESPLLQLDPRGVRKNSFLRTMLVTRDIREAIGNSNLKMRPYVLRSYFDTALDISESKGLISHPWRMFIMGHKGDIESRYSTNKRLPPEIIEEMREAYRRSEKYFSIETSNNEVNNLQLFVKKQVLLIAGYSQEDIDSMNIQEMTDDEITQKVKDRMVYSAKEALTRNGAGQILVRKGKVRDFLGKGFEFVADLNDGNVIMKMP
jgi:heat shock protein HspQ